MNLFIYDYSKKELPIIDVLCNECGEFFELENLKQKEFADFFLKIGNGTYTINPGIEDIITLPSNTAITKETNRYDWFCLPKFGKKLWQC